MILLFDLPTDISITVLRDWVANFKALSALDVAVGHTHRWEWFGLTRDPIFVLPTSPRFKSEEVAIAYVQWVNTRLLKVEALVVTPALIGAFTKMSCMALRSATSLQLNDTRCKPKQFTNASSDLIQSLLLLLPSLTVVDLLNSGEQNQRLVLTHLSSMPSMPLKDLHLDTDGSLCDALSMAVETFHRSLQVLEPGTISGALLTLIGEKCVNLQCLYISCDENVCAHTIIENLASDRLPLLTDLSISAKEVLTDEVAMDIFAKHTTLIHFGSYDDSTILLLGCASALESCPNLVSYHTRAVDLYELETDQHYRLDINLGDPAPAIESTQLAIAMSQSGKFRKIGGINFMDKLSNATVLSIAANCPALESAHISLQDDVNDDAITALVVSCGLLQRLSLFGCKGITNRSLQAIADHCVNLTDITLRGGEQITDLGLHELLSQRGSTLSELCLPNCTLLTRLSLTFSVALCPFLTKLDIADTQLTEADVMEAIVVPNAFLKMEGLVVGMKLLPVLLSKQEVAQSRWSKVVSYW